MLCVCCVLCSTFYFPSSFSFSPHNTIIYIHLATKNESRMKFWRRSTMTSISRSWVFSAQIRNSAETKARCKCGTVLTPKVSGKDNSNKGREYVSCSTCSHFEWVGVLPSKMSAVGASSLSEPSSAPSKLTRKHLTIFTDGSCVGE